MTVIPINLAIEDDLSEAVLRRLLDHADREYFVGTAYGRSGSGYLRRTVNGWNRAAQGTPFAVLTDLDQFPCATELVETWLSRGPKHPNLLLRVAVREVESWLLADGRNLSSYLGIHQRWLPEDPDSLEDPKRTLVQLAGRSRSFSIRQRIVPKVGSTAKQGRNYNDCLSAFVNGAWDVELARTRSPSLERAMKRFETFEPTW